ncbi:MAG TPA: hypothetical protein VNT51_04855 [Miltoncostaeaceae bacterium]|nr:hypothetical protein [Miltoncostaeaceae bacterium]
MGHELPPGDAVVVEWASTGPGGSGSAADLLVRADGTAEAGPRLAGGRTARAHLGRGAVAGLVDEILDRHGFFGIDAGEIERALAASRPRHDGGEGLRVPLGPPYLDAGESRIAVRADGRRHEVRVQGLFAAAREHPEIPALTALREVERLLLRCADRVAAGDPR